LIPFQFVFYNCFNIFNYDEVPLCSSHVVRSLLYIKWTKSCLEDISITECFNFCEVALFSRIHMFGTDASIYVGLFFFDAV
jgi:hypothetical protein